MKRLLLAGAALLISCAEPTIKDGDIESIFTKEREVEHTAEVTISEQLRQNQLVGIIDKYAILQIYDQSTDFNFYVIDVETGEIVNKLVSSGRGHNEMLYPEYIGHCNGKIYIQDQMNEYVVSLPESDLLTKSTDIKFEKVKSQDRSKEFFFPRYLAIAHDRLVCYKSVKDKNDPYLEMVTVEDGQLQDGESFCHFGQGADDENKAYTYEGLFTASPQGDAMIYHTYSGVYLRFYDCSDAASLPQLSKEYNVQTPKHEIEEFGNGQNVSYFITPTDDTICGFSASFSDKDSFYLHYRSMTFKERRAMVQEKNDEWQKITLLVFDKKGKPREKLIVKEPLTAFIKYCVYNDSFYTMGFNDDGEDCLLQYKF